MPLTKNIIYTIKYINNSYFGKYRDIFCNLFISKFKFVLQKKENTSKMFYIPDNRDCIGSH